MREKKKPWRKILYQNLGYPDNYTDKSFLEALKKNVNKRDISVREAILSAGCLTEQLCSVVIFAILFTYLYNLWIEPEAVFVLNGVVTFVAYVVYSKLLSKSRFENFLEDVKTAIKYLVFGYIVSPILKSLTDTISTDTIYATTTFMMIIHLVFFDYKVSAAIVSTSLSLNAAIFGSICLASRLPTPFHAFVLLTASVLFFVLFPFFIYKIGGNLIFLLCVFSIALSSLWTLSYTLTVLFVIAVFFLNLVFPYLFVRWQNYKDNIYGPWDEAIVHDYDT